MDKWEMVRLGDVAPQKAASFQNKGEKVWSLTLDMVESNTGRIIEYIYASSGDIGNSTVKFDEQNVLYSKLRPYLNKVVLPAKNGVATSELIALRPVAQKLSREYLVYYLRSPFFVSFISEKVSGAKMPRVVSSEFFNSRLPLPPLDEQKRIAKNLDLASEIIKGYKEQLAELDKLVQSVFYEMFGDPVTNEKGWETTTLGRYIELLTDFSANGAYEYLDSHVKMYDEPNYALMIRTTDLEKNDFTNGVKYIDENAYKILSKSKVFGNEIVMSKIGSAGKIYLMPKLNMPVSLGRNAFLIRIKQDIDVIFLYNLLSTNYGRAEIMQYVRGAVTKTITKDSVRAIRLVIPPLECQTHYTTIVTEIETQKAQVQQALTEAENLFNSLMQEYFE